MKRFFYYLTRKARVETYLLPELTKQPTELEEWFANNIIGYIRGEIILSERENRETDFGVCKQLIINLLRQVLNS
jgi:hypothetical protein